MSLLRVFTSLLLCVLASSSVAQAQRIDVKVIGASFFEAPPLRDKNLAIFATGSTQEKVEVHVILSSTVKRFTEAGSSFDKGDVKVTAVLPNKALLSLGTAEIVSFPKFSTDGRTITAERRGWGSMNSEFHQEWAFSAPISAGTLNVDIFEELETIQHPIKLVVGKPY